MSEWPKGLDPKRMVHMFERMPSFSLFIFDGDVAAHVPQLLVQLQHEILQMRPVQGDFWDVWVASKVVSGSKNEIGCSTIYRAGTHTVVMDPSNGMLGDGESPGPRQELIDFCRNHSTKGLMAIWERATETAMLVEFSAEGEQRTTCFCQGKPEEQNRPHAALVSRPSGAGLVEAMKEYVDPSTIFGRIECVAYQIADRRVYDFQK
ncbi:MAG: hypothetical protein ACYDCL_10970 [Myxococcales bacterium]